MFWSTYPILSDQSDCVEHSQSPAHGRESLWLVRSLSHGINHIPWAINYKVCNCGLGHRRLGGGGERESELGDRRRQSRTPPAHRRESLWPVRSLSHGIHQIHPALSITKPERILPGPSITDPERVHPEPSIKNAESESLSGWFVLFRMVSTIHPTLEANQGQILSQSFTDTTSLRHHLYGI